MQVHLSLIVERQCADRVFAGALDDECVAVPPDGRPADARRIERRGHLVARRLQRVRAQRDRTLRVAAAHDAAHVVGAVLLGERRLEEIRPCSGVVHVAPIVNASKRGM